MDNIFDVWRVVIIVWIGLLVPPMAMIGWRRKNPGIFALAIFAITGAVVATKEFGAPYPGVQMPLRTIACILAMWWLWQQRHDPAIKHFTLHGHSKWDGVERRTPV